MAGLSFNCTDPFELLPCPLPSRVNETLAPPMFKANVCPVVTNAFGKLNHAGDRTRIATAGREIGRALQLGDCHWKRRLPAASPIDPPVATPLPSRNRRYRSLSRRFPIRLRYRRCRSLIKAVTLTDELTVLP